MTRSAKKTRPMAFDGTPKYIAINVVIVEARIRHVNAFAKLLLLDSIAIYDLQDVL